MDIQTIKVNTRGETGKGPARQGRMAGTIPAVIYGESKASVALTVNAKAFAAVVHGSQGEHAVVHVEVEDKPELSGPSLIKDVQHHPIREHIVHADFLRIKLDQAIQTLVPINLVGHCVGLVEGGVPDQQLRELEIECLPLDVPDQIDVDIANLHIGELLHVSDLEKQPNLTILTDPERTIIAIHAPRVATADSVEAEEVEEGAAEGAED